MKEYRIIPLRLSETIMEPCAAFYYKAYTGEKMPFVYGCFALINEEDEDIIMVDTGLASQEDIEKYDYPFRRMPGAPSLKQVMEEKGLDPLNVKTIIFTHLHQDHCFNLELFPNADLYVQKAELQHAATPTAIEAKSYQKYDKPGLPAWARAFGRIITVEGDTELPDGVMLLLTPGHTPGSQSVVVKTAAGLYYMTGDNYYFPAQFESGRMVGNFTNLEDWYSSRIRIQNEMKKTGGKLLCVHDPNAYAESVIG